MQQILSIPAKHTEAGYRCDPVDPWLIWYQGSAGLQTGLQVCTCESEKVSLQLKMMVCDCARVASELFVGHT